MKSPVLYFVVMVSLITILQFAFATTSAPESGFAACHSRSLMRIKAAIVRSDYRAELDLLNINSKKAGDFSRDPACAGAAAYWEGFAHWRYATNAANGPAQFRQEIASRLELAATALRRAVAAMPNDPDAKIALMGVVQMRPIFEQQGSDHWHSAIIESRKLLAELEPVASVNPRFLWLRGGMYFWAPAPFGGGPDAAIEAYRTGLAHLRERPGPTTGLAPSSGEPGAGDEHRLCRRQTRRPGFSTGRNSSTGSAET
jgi:hypothetical protein